MQYVVNERVHVSRKLMSFKAALGRLKALSWAATIVVPLLYVGMAEAELYQWTDADGQKHFGDNPPAEHQATVLAVDTHNNTFESQSDTLNKPAEQQLPPLTLYSTQWCGYCKKARKFFANNHIPFREFDIEKNNAARREYERQGGRGVPFIVAGETTMRGFSESKFAKTFPQYMPQYTPQK